jgi:hypothetical protein
VLRLLALGRTYDEAGQELGISRNTVNRHAAEARAVLGVTCQAEACIQLGWLQVPAARWVPPPADFDGQYAHWVGAHEGVS